MFQSARIGPDRRISLAIFAGVSVVLWLLTRRRLWTLLNPKVKKRLATLTEEMGDKQAFVPYVLAGFLLTAVWIQ